MIVSAVGNIFNAPAEVLVNPVNCVGVMGRGLAFQFKKKFPGNFDMYSVACKRGELTPGKVYTVQERGKFIVNFPTKDHWKDPSRLEWIETGLDSLIDEICNLELKTVAIPALGCGLGGLDWYEEVRSLIISKFEEYPEIKVYLYEPE